MVVANRKGTPTIRDVARRSGVSAQTVSRVLNNPELVLPATRERVERGIAELDYRPSPIARGLAINRSGSIGVVDSGSDVLGQLMMVARVQSAAREHGYSAQVAVADPRSRDTFDAAFDQLRNARVEGLIVLGNTTLHMKAADRAASRVPVVIISSTERRSERFSVVAVDQVGGMLKAIEHVRSYGDRIGHISGPAGWVDADARLNAWRLNTPAGNVDLLVQGDWSAKSGYVGMNLLLERGVDAVVCANDLMAIGALRACHERGLDVPGDVAVTGFDDIAGTDFLTPALTTVRQPFADVGIHAVELLAKLLAGGQPEHRTLATEFIVRDSA